MIEQPARERGGQLAHDLVDREIPRRERRDRADRLLHRELVDAGPARGDQPAIGALGFLRKPLDHVSGGHRLHLGLGQRLALLHRQQRRDLVIALAHDRGGLAHDPAALERGNVAPDLEAGGGGGERLVEIGLASMGDGADHLLGRGIAHLDHFARMGRAPFAGNEKLGVRIGQRNLLLFLCWIGCVGRWATMLLQTAQCRPITEFPRTPP